jgi:polysaccharide biosynthesis protein PslH
MRSGDLRILVVGQRFPFPPRSGFETRFYHLVLQLARRYDVTLLTYLWDDQVGDVDGFGADARVEFVRWHAPSPVRRRARQLAAVASREAFAVRSVRSGEMQAAIDRLSARTRFDAVQVESVLPLVFRFPPRARVVIDEHNIEYEVFERMRAVERSLARKLFYGVEQARVRRFEQSGWRRAAACVVTSEREEQIVRAAAPATPVAIVPNAVDLDRFRPSGRDVDAGTIVFNGVLDYHPNVDAAAFLVEEVLPLVRERRPDVTLTIVGRGRPAVLERLRRPGVDVTGEVADVRPYLERTAVEVVPVRMGGGTRLKVLEGLALEKPMVSTTLGCEGIDVRHGEHLLVADTAEAFASAVVRLLEDSDLAGRLGRAGRRLVGDHYSWDAAGERLAELYGSLRGSFRAGELPASAGGR